MQYTAAAKYFDTREIPFFLAAHARTCGTPAQGVCLQWPLRAASAACYFIDGSQMDMSLCFSAVSAVWAAPAAAAALCCASCKQTQQPALGSRRPLLYSQGSATVSTSACSHVLERYAKCQFAASFGMVLISCMARHLLQVPYPSTASTAPAIASARTSTREL